MTWEQIIALAVGVPMLAICFLLLYRLPFDK